MLQYPGQDIATGRGVPWAARSKAVYCFSFCDGAHRRNFDPEKTGFDPCWPLFPILFLLFPYRAWRKPAEVGLSALSTFTFYSQNREFWNHSTRFSKDALTTVRALPTRPVMINSYLHWTKSLVLFFITGHWLFLLLEVWVWSHDYEGYEGCPHTGRCA